MKPIMKKNFLIIAALAALGLFSCKKDGSSGSECTGGTATCTFDGATFTATAFNNTLIKDKYDVISGVPAKRLDIRISDGTKIIILTISDHRDGIVGDGVRLDTWFTDSDEWVCDASSICLSALITVTNAAGTEMLYSSGIDNTGQVKITSVDAASKKVSGTFSGTINSFSGGDPVVITNGVFTNNCYTVTTIE